MAYSNLDKEMIFNEILEEIHSGASLISTLSVNGMPSTSTFYIWIEEDESKSKRYACACEARELKILDEILEIADKQCEDIIEKDGIILTNHNVIQRNKLQIEARQWYLGKVRPEKYGNKTILSGDPDKPITINFED